MEGRNAREADVELAWERVVDHIVGAAPDLVTIAGDCFHHPRVGTSAEIAFRSGIRRIVRGTEAHVVILQGNHDAVKTAAARSPIWIPADYKRVHVVDTPKRIRFIAASTFEDVAVACFPYVALTEDVSYLLEPDEEADVNVLALHGAVKGGGGERTLPWFYVGDRALDVGREADRWDVVACGDFHEVRRLHPDRLAFYSGAIERTSSNVWDETEPKGIVVYDTGDGSLEFVEHETRDLVSYDFHDIVPFTETPGAWTVNDALTELATYDLEGSIVRLKVEDFPRGHRQEVDWETVRELKATCLHFEFDLRFSESRSILSTGEGGRRTATLDDDARAFFEEDDSSLRQLAFNYLGVQTPKENHQEDEAAA